MGFRWVQIGYWVLVLGGFHKYWLFLVRCASISWFQVVSQSVVDVFRLAHLRVFQRYFLVCMYTWVLGWPAIQSVPFPIIYKNRRGFIPSLCSLDIENSLLVGQWYFPNWWKKIHHTSGTSESGFLKFEKWKVKIKSFHSFSRSAKWKNNAFTLFREVQSEIKMLSLFFEKWKVKSKCFEIEIEKWKFSRNLNNSRETRFLNRFIPWKPNKTAETNVLPLGNNHGHFHNLTILKGDCSFTNLLYCRHLILVTYIWNRGSESFFKQFFDWGQLGLNTLS